jgi:hypothetical protein
MISYITKLEGKEAKVVFGVTMVDCDASYSLDSR